MAEPGLSIKSLPQEVLTTIVEYAGTDSGFEDNTGRQTLKILRGFRTFNEAATHLLFREFVFRPHLKPADWKKRPKFTCGRYVRNLIVETIEYQYKDWDLVRFRAKIDRRNNPDMHNYAHLHQACGIYTRLRDQHLDSLAANDGPARLTFLLSSMPNVHKVVLTGDQQKGYMDEYSQCHLWDCMNPMEDHQVLAVGPRAGLYDLGREHFVMLMSALSTTSTRVKELEVVSRDQGHALNHRVLDLSPARMHHTVDVLSCLTRLNLQLFADEFEPMDLTTLEGSTTDSSPVARILSHARKLEQLDLLIETQYGSNQKGDFKTMMWGCELPSLRTCLLRDWNIESKDLFDVLARSPNLAELSLVCCHFTDGTLDFVLGALRQRKPSLRVHLS